MGVEAWPVVVFRGESEREVPRRRGGVPMTPWVRGR